MAVGAGGDVSTWGGGDSEEDSTINQVGGGSSGVVSVSMGTLGFGSCMVTFGGVGLNCTLGHGCLFFLFKLVLKLWLHGVLNAFEGLHMSVTT